MNKKTACGFAITTNNHLPLPCKYQPKKLKTED
jgi:hypothetical protein